MATDTKQKVQCFFSALDEAKIVDNEIVDYLASILDPESIDDSTLTDVQLIVASTSAAFARLPEDKQTQLLLKLFDQINHSTTASTAVFAVTDAGIGSGVQACKLSSIAAALNQLDLCTEQSPAARAPHESDSQQQASANEVAALMDMCQCSVSREFITSVLLEQCKGNVEAAADWLIECEDIASAVRHWRADKEQQQEADQQSAFEQKRKKQDLLHRFDLQAVPASDTSKKRQDKPLQLWPPSKQNQPAAKVRYRDGQIATSKGEKYVIEKIGEEWDGGSKGKVYTKGKRGKGFH
eukprot:jgi/Chrzof1/11053/Cz05g21250.t1